MIILNEKKYAEEILQRNSIDDKPFFSLTILAKYYFYCFGYKKKEITRLLTEYLTEHYPRYKSNKLSWDDTIEKVAKNAGKYPLHEIDGVWITSAELETIEKINDRVLEKIAFTLLCLAKLGNLRNPKNNGWSNEDVKDVYSLARVACSVQDRFLNLCYLKDMSLLEFPRRLDNLSRRVTFINDDSDKVLFVSDFRELGYEYLKYKGENITACRECGILFRNNKEHSKMYCPHCGMYVQRNTKLAVCMDCGKEFEVSRKNSRTVRCESCQKKRKREESKQKEIKVCERCGQIYTSSSNFAKYCPECASIVHREQKNESDRKRRKQILYESKQNADK